MAKVQRSIRLEANTIARIEARAEKDGATFSATIEKAISEGMDAMNREQTDEPPSPVASALASDYIESLKAQVSTLEKQLDVKDEQIAALNEQAATLQRLTDQAQQLHAISEKQSAEAKALETAEANEQRKGFWARLMGL